MILASSSPRRRELLTRVGLPFEIYVPDVDESCNLDAAQAVCELSARKGSACLPLYSGRTILAADTLVALNHTVLGKPASTEEASAMLHLLAGNTHHVYTGVSVLSPDGRRFTAADCTAVTFCPLSDGEIDEYIRSGEPMDKAGAYAVQGKAAWWITRIEGSYSSVMGLPLYLVRQLLLKAGYPIPGAPVEPMTEI